MNISGDGNVSRLAPQRMPGTGRDTVPDLRIAEVVLDLREREQNQEQREFAFPPRQP
jgi:hypothetical protein